MPTPGLSLVGFMDQVMALRHLRESCVPVNPSDTALLADWNAAKGRIGGPIPNAGKPDIQMIPATHDAHINALRTLPWINPNPLALAEFRLVEINPLLAYQFSVDLPRSSHHCAALQNPPTLDELLSICLPISAPQDPFQVIRQSQSILIKSKSLNLLKLGDGIFYNQFAGLCFGNALPFVHVVRFNGRCYLHNGFHRSYGVRLAGATHIPC